jgi:hypothetical protein
MQLCGQSAAAAVAPLRRPVVHSPAAYGLLYQIRRDRREETDGSVLAFTRHRGSPVAWPRLGTRGAPSHRPDRRAFHGPAALNRAKAILGGGSLKDVASWADDYRGDHRETGPGHYIDIPLVDSNARKP